MGKVEVLTKTFKAVGTIHNSINYDKEKHIEIPLAISFMKSRIDEIQQRTGTVMMIFGFEGTEPGGCIWKLAAEVTTIENVPDGMIPIEIPEKQYAHYHYSGGKNDFGSAYDVLFDWINKNGDSSNGGEMIERWEDMFPYESEQWEMHLYIPFTWKNNNELN